MDKSTAYTTAAGVWRRSTYVNIYSILDTEIAIFPVDFLSTCGDNTWGYVLFAIGCVVDPDPLHLGQIVDHQNVPVSLDSAPVAGNYRYIETGKLGTVDR